jgi:hypothetical protein
LLVEGFFRRWHKPRTFCKLIVDSIDFSAGAKLMRHGAHGDGKLASVNIFTADWLLHPMQLEASAEVQGNTGGRPNARKSGYRQPA